MSEQHTPTPWGFSRDDENGVEFNITSDKWYVAVCCDEPGNGTSQSNARRVVACVNACAGIPTDDLEQCPSGGLFHIADHANELVKQRDELLAALEGARESLDAIHLAVEPYDDIKPRDWKSDRANLRDAHTSAKETIEAVDTAIASVKANTK